MWLKNVVSRQVNTSYKVGLHSYPMVYLSLSVVIRACLKMANWVVGALRLGCSVYKHLPSGHQTSDGDISDGTGDFVLQLSTIFRLRMTGSHWVTAYQNDLSPFLETKKTFGG